MGTIQDQESQVPKSEEHPPEPPSPIQPEINPEVPNENNPKTTNESADNNQNIVPVIASGDSDIKTSDPPNPLPKDGGGEGSVVASKSGTVVQKSGIPAISRIARPCTGQVKPAVPPTPTKNACDDLRNLSDDFGKHRLTDVQEENEEETLVPSLSSRRLGSMDALWDTYSHRLSEAGLVRHSDNSVLTEDTDSFIIGDRVWVGGNKPGQIAYIGETQFAPGEWAGIALDQPIGKNDGSVGGTRYFQCEAKRGVFSRLTRLTRIPLAGADDASICSSSFAVTSTPINNGVRRRVGSPLSPHGSTRSLRKSPPLSTSNTSLASTTHHIIDFKVGDRVIIKSSQGSKIGTLRYMGITDFASGEWCGVELDEPRGKNDGSVEGKRYFECRPQFGLFAPVTKVSKSPMKYKPGNCVIHSGVGLPPSGIMKRTGSKESMTSMTSSLASATSGARRVRLGVNSLTPQRVSPKTPTASFPTRTALQDVLREKQLHIEQLLKERDLERSEVTRAASQADEAEQKLTTLRSEYEHYRSECESKLQEYSVLLSEFNVDRGSLLSQLDDEKRKNEDLQFRFEEAAITKGDIEVTNETNIHRITELEEQLAAERQRAEALESDSGKLFEAEEALVKTREEVDVLKNELQHVIEKRSVLEGEQVASSESLTSLKQQLEGTQKQLEDARAESTKIIEELQSELSKSAVLSQATRSSFDKELDGYQSRLQQNEANCKKQDDEIAALKAELAQTKALLEEKSVALENEIMQSNALENRLKTELERSKRELGAKTVDLENNSDVLKSQESEIRSLKTQLETTELDLKSRVLDVERYQRSLQETESNCKNEVDQLRSDLKAKISEKEEQETESAIALSQRNAQLEEATKTISQYSAEIEKLKTDLVEAKESVERSSTEIHERHSRQIEARELQLMAMAAEIQQKNEEITKGSIITTKLEDDICTKNGIIEKLHLELDSFKRRFESEQLSITRYNEQINALQLSSGDLQRKLAAAEQRILELIEQKQRREDEMQGLLSSTGDYSAKLQQLTAELLEKDRLIETIKTEFVEKLQQAQRIEQQVKIELQKVTEDSHRSRTDFEEKLKTAFEGESMLRQRCETANAETSRVRDELMLRVTELQRLLEQKDFALKKNIDDRGENEQHLKEQLGRATVELQKTIESCQKRIDELTHENIEAKNIAAQKSELIIETEAKLKHFVMESQQNELEIRRTCDEQLRKAEFQLAEKNAQLQQYISETELLQRDCASQNINVADKDHKIAQLINELRNTQLLVTQFQNERDKLQLIQAETAKQCSANNQQCNDLLNQVSVLSGRAEMADKLAQDLRVQKTIYAQLFEHLQITEKQKHTLIARLEDAANKHGEADKCYYMLELAKNIQATTSDEQTKKIIELQQIVQLTQQKLLEGENQLQAHQGEILKLQEALVKAQQVCATQGLGPQNSVSFVHGSTPNTPLHMLPQFLNPLQNARLLEIQLMTAKNSLAALIQRFIKSQRLNTYLINQLRNAVNSGDKLRIYWLLRELARVKQYFNVFQNNIEADKFKLLKAISYATLSIQQKQLTINALINQIKQLQNNYNNLPLQCKLASHVIPPPASLVENSMNGVEIELDKTSKLLELKEAHILNLNNQLMSLHQNLKAACPVTVHPGYGSLPQPPNFVHNTAPPIQTGNQLHPSLQCPAPKIIIKEVPVFLNHPPQKCRQVFPPFALNQNGPNCIGANRPSTFIPANVIIRRIPVLIPQAPKTIIKEIPVPMIAGGKCPSPRVLIQRVPVLSSPRVVVKEVPILQPPKVVVKEVLVPMIHGRRCPSPQVVIQKVPVVQPARVIVKEIPIPQPAQIIIKQVPVHLPPRIVVKEVPVFLKSGSQCPRPQVIVKEVPVMQPPRTIVRVIPIPQPPRLVQVPCKLRQQCLPSTQPNTPSLDLLQQLKNQINYLKLQIQNLLLHPKTIIKEVPTWPFNTPSIPESTVNPTLSQNVNAPLLQLLKKQKMTINYLMQKIQNLILYPTVPFRPNIYSNLETPLVGPHVSPNSTPCMMLVAKLRSQINYLRQQIQNLLLYPKSAINGGPLVQPNISPIQKSPLVGPQVSPYLMLIGRLSNQINYLRLQIQNLLLYPKSDNNGGPLGQPNISPIHESPLVGPTVSPNNAPYLMQIGRLRNQINDVLQQIQNSLLYPKSAVNGGPWTQPNIHPTPESHLVGSTVSRSIAPYLKVIGNLRNHIYYLNQQIQNLLSNPKVVVKEVPIPQSNIYPTSDSFMVGPTTSPNNAPYLVLIGKLRNQINYLTQQLQNVLLHPKVVIKKVPVVRPNTIDPTSESQLVGPNVLPNLKPYLVLIGRLKNQINFLTLQIQNILSHPKEVIKEVPVLQPNLYPTPETPLIDLSLGPNYIPSLEVVARLNNQINYLTQQIQYLLLNPQVIIKKVPTGQPNISPTPGYSIVRPTVAPNYGPYLVLIQNLRNQIQNLLLHPKVVLKAVPVPVVQPHNYLSPKIPPFDPSVAPNYAPYLVVIGRQRNQINYLNQQIQNLSLHLKVSMGRPNISPSPIYPTVGSTVAPNYAPYLTLIANLRNQIQNLLLHPKVIVKEVPVLRPTTPAISPFGPTATPNYGSYLTLIRRQGNQIKYLTQQIQNLLLHPNVPIGKPNISPTPAYPVDGPTVVPNYAPYLTLIANLRNQIQNLLLHPKVILKEVPVPVVQPHNYLSPKIPPFDPSVAPNYAPYLVVIGRQRNQINYLNQQIQNLSLHLKVSMGRPNISPSPIYPTVGSTVAPNYAPYLTLIANLRNQIQNLLLHPKVIVKEVPVLRPTTPAISPFGPTATPNYGSYLTLIRRQGNQIKYLTQQIQNLLLHPNVPIGKPNISPTPAYPVDGPTVVPNYAPYLTLIANLRNQIQNLLLHPKVIVKEVPVPVVQSHNYLSPKIPPFDPSVAPNYAPYLVVIGRQRNQINYLNQQIQNLSLHLKVSMGRPNISPSPIYPTVGSTVAPNYAPYLTLIANLRNQIQNLLLHPKVIVKEVPVLRPTTPAISPFGPTATPNYGSYLTLIRRQGNQIKYLTQQIQNLLLHPNVPIGKPNISPTPAYPVDGPTVVPNYAPYLTLIANLRNQIQNLLLHPKVIVKEVPVLRPTTPAIPPLGPTVAPNYAPCLTLIANLRNQIQNLLLHPKVIVKEVPVLRPTTSANPSFGHTVAPNYAPYLTLIANLRNQIQNLLLHPKVIVKEVPVLRPTTPATPPFGPTVAPNYAPYLTLIANLRNQIQNLLLHPKLIVKEVPVVRPTTPAISPFGPTMAPNYAPYLTLIANLRNQIQNLLLHPKVIVKEVPVLRPTTPAIPPFGPTVAPNYAPYLTLIANLRNQIQNLLLHPKVIVKEVPVLRPTTPAIPPFGPTVAPNYAPYLTLIANLRNQIQNLLLHPKVIVKEVPVLRPTTPAIPPFGPTVAPNYAPYLTLIANLRNQIQNLLLHPKVIVKEVPVVRPTTPAISPFGPTMAPNYAPYLTLIANLRNQIQNLLLHPKVIVKEVPVLRPTTPAIPPFGPTVAPNYAPYLTLIANLRNQIQNLLLHPKVIVKEVPVLRPTIPVISPFDPTVAPNYDPYLVLIGKLRNQINYLNQQIQNMLARPKVVIKEVPVLQPNIYPTPESSLVGPAVPPNYSHYLVLIGKQRNQINYLTQQIQNLLSHPKVVIKEVPVAQPNIYPAPEIPLIGPVLPKNLPSLELIARLQNQINYLTQQVQNLLLHPKVIFKEIPVVQPNVYPTPEVSPFGPMVPPKYAPYLVLIRRQRNQIDYLTQQIQNLLLHPKVIIKEVPIGQTNIPPTSGSLIGGPSVAPNDTPYLVLIAKLRNQIQNLLLHPKVVIKEVPVVQPNYYSTPKSPLIGPIVSPTNAPYLVLIGKLRNQINYLTQQIQILLQQPKKIAKEVPVIQPNAYPIPEYRPTISPLTPNYTPYLILIAKQGNQINLLLNPKVIIKEVPISRPIGYPTPESPSVGPIPYLKEVPLGPIHVYPTPESPKKVYIYQRPNVVIKEIPRKCPNLPSLIKPAACILPSQVVNNIKLNGFSNVDIFNFKKGLYNLLLQQLICSLSNCRKPETNNIVQHFCTPSNYRPVVPVPPRIIIKQVPVMQAPKTIIKVIHVPVGVGQQCPPPKVLLQRFPVSLPPKIIIKEVPVNLPPKIVIKQIPVPIIGGVKCPGPQILLQRVPVPIYQPPRTILKEVPIPQPPRIIIKEVTVPQPSQPIIKYVPVPIIRGSKCPAPQVIVQKVPIMQPPRIIVRELPLPQPPRVIIKEVAVQQPPRIIIKEVPKILIKEIQRPCSASQISPSIVPPFLPPKIVIKEVPVPIGAGQQCPPPKVILQRVPVPQPPKVLVKIVGVPLPPKIIVKQILVPVIQGTQCPSPKILVQRVPVVLPPRTIIKELSIPQPPRIVVKEVPVSQPPRVIVKLIPIPIKEGVKCPAPNVFIQKVPVLQPPRIIVKEVAVAGPPRIIIKEVPIPQPARIVVKEVLVPRPPKIIIKQIPVPFIHGIKCPAPRVIFQRIPVVQPPRTIIKEVPVSQPCSGALIHQLETLLKYTREELKRTKIIYEQKLIAQPPRIIIKQVPILQPPKVLIKEIPVLQPPRTVIKEVPNLQPPRTIVIKVPVSQPPIIKKIPIPILQPPRIIIKKVVIPQPPRILIKEVPIPQPPRIIIKNIPVPILQPPRTIVKEIPIFQPPRTVVKEVPMLQPPRTIIQQVPIPQPPIIRKIPVVILQPPRTIIKEVLVPQPPRIIIKQVPIRQPPIIRKVSVPILQPPRILIKQIPVPQPPRIIIKEVPIPQPPRIIIKNVPVLVPTLQPPRVIIKEVQIPQQPKIIVKVVQGPPRIRLVPVAQPPRIVIKEIPIPVSIGSKCNAPKVILQRIPVPQPPQLIIKRVPVLLPPKIIIKQIPVPIIHGTTCPAPKIILQRIPILQPPRTILKEVPIPQPPQIVVKEVFVPQPPRVIIKQVPIPVVHGNKCPAPRVIQLRVPIVQPARTIIKEVAAPQPPRIIVKEVPIPQQPRVIVKEVPVPVPQPPQVIIKQVPIPVMNNIKCPAPRIILQRIPVLQPPRTIIKEVSIPQPPQIIIKQVQVPQPPRVIIKQVPIHIIDIRGVKCPAPRVVIQKIPIMQPPQTIIKEIPVQQPPRIILKEVPILQKPRIIVKEVLVPMPCALNTKPPECLVQQQTIKELLERTKEYYEKKLMTITQHPRVIVKEVPVRLPARTVIKQVLVPVIQGVKCPAPRIILQRVPVIQPPKIILKAVPISQPPRIIVKQVPAQCPPPKTIIKEIPVPMRSESQCRAPKLILHRVPVPQPPKIIVKQVPVLLPPKIIIKQIPVPIIHGRSCPAPKIIIQRIPVLQPPRTILKEVPIPQPPRIIVKEIPVPQPQQPIIKYIQIPVSPNIKCPIPRVIIQKVPVVQPPRIIIKEVPVPQPPRIIVKEGRIIQQPRYIIKEVPIPQPCPSPKTIIREVPVPVSTGGTFTVPQFIIHRVPVPQPPKIIIKTVPVSLPPKIVIKQVPVFVIQGMKCPAPKVIIQRVPVLQPPRTIIKEVSIPQPPRIVIKEVPVPQPPQIIIKQVPVPIIGGVKCPAPRVILQRIPVVQPPRTIIKEILVAQPPRIILKEVPVPQPPRVIVKEVAVPAPYRQQPCPAPNRPFSNIKIIPILQPPRTILKEVPVPIGNGPNNIPKIIIHRVPLLLPPKIVVKTVSVVLPPKVIMKLIPVPVIRGTTCPGPKVLIQRIPVLQPPRTVLKEVPIFQPPQIIVKEVLVPQPPRVIVKQIPVPIIQGVKCPSPRVILQRVPVWQPPRTIVKEVLVPQPPRVIVKLLPQQPRVIVKEVPKIIIKEVPAPSSYLPRPCSDSLIRPLLPNLYIPDGVSPNEFVTNLPLTGFSPSEIFRFKQQLLHLLLQPFRNIAPAPYSTQSTSQICPQLPNLAIPDGTSPNDFIRNLPLFGYSPLQILRFKQQLIKLLTQHSQNSITRFVPFRQPIRTVIREIPVPVIGGRSCPPPKLIIHPVQVPQNPTVIIKQVPVTLPPRIIVRVIRLPIIQGGMCPPPRMINQPVPVFTPPRTIFKEVPIQQPPRIIIKEVPVLQPLRVVVKHVPVPIIQGTQCPPPKTLIQKVPVLQPPRIIIKEVPIVQRPRIIVKEVVVPQPPKLIIKEVAIPQPPRIIIKNVPVFGPLPNNNYLLAKNLVRPGGCIRPADYINSLAIIQKQIREINNLKLGLFADKGRVSPTNYPPPRLILKEVPALNPSNNYNYLSTQTPRKLQEALRIQENVIHYQKTEIYRLEREVQKLLGKVSACSSYLSGSPNSFPGVSQAGNPLIDGLHGFISHVPLQRQCIAQLQKQRTLIRSLKYRIQQLLRSCSGSVCKQDFSRISDNNRAFAKPPISLKPSLPIVKSSPIQNIPPLPLMHVLKSITPSISYPLIQPVLPSASPSGLQTSFVKALHEAFSHTQQALTHCMNAVLIQQLAFNQSQINNNVVCSDHQQLLQEKQLAEGQVQFLNTIIVDMQRKNEEQRARIEILESGFSPAAADELKLYGMPQHSVPPRVYCDICEEFDKHETEECPLQATDDDPAPCSHPRTKKEAQPERPYCEICEIFGHCTEDCKDDQTF